MATASVPYLTPEQYLEIERKAEVRSEYLNGEMFAMAGSTFNHNRILRNTERELDRGLAGRKCDVFMADVKVHVPSTGLYTYPDIAVVCDPVQSLDQAQDVFLNPVLIVEVLSPSTMKYDKGHKFGHYRSIPSFREYLVLDQDAMHAEHHVRQMDGKWLLSDYNQPTDVIHLEAIDCQLTLASLYTLVEFPPTA